MAPQRFRKKAVEIDAMRWDGTDACADAMWEWTATPSEILQGAVSTMFMVLGEDDAYEVFSCYDDDLELIPDNEVDRIRAEGYSAVVFDRLHGTWVNVATGDWVIRGVQGEFYPCKPDIFAATYEAVV